MTTLTQLRHNFRSVAWLLCLVMCGIALTSSALSAQEVTWKAGVAKAIITPEKGVWLAGYGSKRAPDGKLHDLWMKALALEDPKGNRVVLVTSDGCEVLSAASPKELIANG